jgi:3-oxoacyl-[acyl-carrier-protein] synthase-3
MDGKKVFNFISKTVPIQINSLLKKNNLEINDISQFIFHQASKFTIDALINTLELDISKCFINIENIGNTVSASIPIALKHAIDQGKIKKGDIILLSGFGVGLSWGTTLLKF